MVVRLDRETIERVLRKGMRQVRKSDIVRVIRRSPALRRLVVGPLADLADDLNTLMAMLKDYAAGRYAEVPQRTILAATVALLYVLNPFDLVPDFVPGVGLVDDAAIVTMVLRSIQYDVHTYRSWAQKLRRRVRQIAAAI